MGAARPTRLPRPPRGPASRSSSSPIMATPRGRPTRRFIDRASCVSTPWRSARAADITWRSTCRRRRIRSPANRAMSSTTYGGSAGSASRRIRIRRKRSCAGAIGMRRSTAWSGSIRIRAGVCTLHRDSDRASGSSKGCFTIRSGRRKRWPACSRASKTRWPIGTRWRAAGPSSASPASTHTRSCSSSTPIRGTIGCPSRYRITNRHFVCSRCMSHPSALSPGTRRRMRRS